MINDLSQQNISRGDITAISSKHQLTYIGRCVSIVEDFILRNCVELIKLAFNAVKYIALVIKSHLNRNLKSPYTSAFYLSLLAILSYLLQRIRQIVNRTRLDRFSRKHTPHSINQVFNPIRPSLNYDLKVNSMNYWRLEAKKVMHLQKLSQTVTKKLNKPQLSTNQKSQQIHSHANDSAFFKILVCYLRKL